MTSTFTAGDGCRIAYRFDGDDNAPVLLLSNSLGTTMAMWEPQIAAFSRHFRVLRYDSRGHGGSDAPDGAYSLDRLGRDVLELLDRLEIPSVEFCGLSLGGMIGQWLGYRAPERVRRLVLANTSDYMGPPANWDARIALVRSEGLASLAAGSVARWFTPEFVRNDPAAVGRIVEALAATSPAGYAGCCAAIRDMDMRLTGTLHTVPTLLIGGERDPATPPADTDRLGETLRNATSVFLDAAHLSNVEQPEAFAAHVIGFICGK